MALSRRSGWVLGVVGMVGAGVVVGMVGTVVFRFGWTEPRSIEFTREVMQSFDHDSDYAHGEEDQLPHFYMHNGGRVVALLHRHCPTHDVNGDGDTTDLEDNDGTCPGPDTGLPDLSWHPSLPNPRYPAWGERVKEAVFLATGTAIALTAILPSVGVPYVARANRRLKLKEAAEVAGPPTTPTD